MAWLRVGQAFGVLLLAGFSVSSPSLQVPGHPTSMCGTSIKLPWKSINSIVMCKQSLSLPLIDNDK